MSGADDDGDFLPLSRNGRGAAETSAEVREEGEDGKNFKRALPVPFQPFGLRDAQRANALLLRVTR